MEEMKCLSEDGRRTGFLSQEVKANGAHDSFTSQGAATKLRRTKSHFVECVAATVEKMDRRFLEHVKTKVIIAAVWDDMSISQSAKNCGTCNFLRDIWCCGSR